MNDLAELERWYREHGDVVLRRAHAILGDKEQALDVLQDLFTELISRGPRFRRESSPVTFLYAATTHRALRRLRDRKNRARLLEENVGHSPQGGHRLAADDLAILRQTLAKVPRSLCAPAVYFHLDGMKQLEIAALLGCSERQVRKLLTQFEERMQQVHPRSRRQNTVPEPADERPRDKVIS